jgi:hypothetical protein
MQLNCSLTLIYLIEKMGLNNPCVLGKLVICLQKTETRSMPVTCTSINSNIRPDTLKLVQEKAIGIGKDLLSRTQVAQQLRERIDKWDYMKLKIFCTAKEMVSKLKRPPTEWEKSFASYTNTKTDKTDNQNIQGAQKLNSPKSMTQ